MEIFPGSSITGEFVIDFQSTSLALEAHLGNL